MKKTFCDCCGEQCINTTVILRIDVLHHTSDFQFVGEDEYKGIEICKKCMDKIREFMPQAFILAHHSDRQPDGEAMEALVRVESRHQQ
jgi:hypothetical protein